MMRGIRNNTEAASTIVHQDDDKDAEQRFQQIFPKINFLPE